MNNANKNTTDLEVYIHTNITLIDNNGNEIVVHPCEPDVIYML